MHFLLQLVTPHAVMCFVLALICLVGFGYPGYRERETSGFLWLLWLLGGLMSLAAWLILVFS